MASDDGDHSALEPNVIEQTTVNKTYANVIEYYSLPKKDQAIVIESVEGISNDEYIDGLEKLINSNDIKFISKISGGRVCVFLSSKRLVEELNGKKVQVKDHLLKIRPLLEKNKRIVISNVCPVIPHDVLVNALKQRGIRIMSQMHYLRAGLNKPGRSHILSFRRRVYVKEEDEPKIPESLQISYEETSYWVYLSTDSTSCFICKQSGHIAKLCPKFIAPQSTPDTPVTQLPKVNEPNSESDLQDEIEVPQLQIADNTNKGIKRPPPPSTISEDSSPKSTASAGSGHNVLTAKNNLAPTFTEDDMNFKKPKKQSIKKLKSLLNPSEDEPTVIPNDLDDKLQTIKNMIEQSPNEYVLNYSRFKSLLVESNNPATLTETIQNLSNDSDSLIKMIDNLYPHLNDRVVKAKFTKLKKKLLALPSSDSEQESDSSQKSTQN